jgi:hypothetical protein
MTKALTHCQSCNCGAAYVPFVAGLVEAQRRPWTNAALKNPHEALKASLPGPLVVTDEHRAAGDAIRTLIDAARS